MWEKAIHLKDVEVFFSEDLYTISTYKSVHKITEHSFHKEVWLCIVVRHLHFSEEIQIHHVTPLLRDHLHWLRARERISFKVCLLV